MRYVFAQVVAALLMLPPVSAPGNPIQNQSEAAKVQDLLPSGSLYSPEELHDNFGAQQFTPFGDRKFYFEILVPKGWESHLSDIDPDQLAQDKESPVTVAEFGPGGGVDDVGIQVSYMRVPEQVGLDRFVADYAQKSNGTVVVQQKAEFKGGAAQDALLKVNAEDLGPMLTRATAFRRGDIVFIVTGGAVEEKYEKNKRLFGAVAANFNPSGK